MMMVVLISFQKQLFHFFKFVESAISKTWWAISFITIDASVAIFIPIYYIFTFKAFYLSNFSNVSNHTLEMMVIALTMFLYALYFSTHS